MTFYEVDTQETLRPIPVRHTHSRRSDDIVAQLPAKATPLPALPSSQIEFVSLLNHDLRTPLNGVVGMVELLLETELSAAQSEMAQIALDSALSLLSTLTNLLQHAESEANKITV